MEADLFDEIVMAENRFVEEGYEEGFRKGIIKGFVEGFELGLTKGVELGSEIGYYEGFVTTAIMLQIGEKSNSRVNSVLNTLDEMLSRFKNFNHHNMDETTLPNIRSKFQQLRSLLKLDKKPTTSKSDYSF